MIRNYTAYLSSWIEALENDPKKTQAADEKRVSVGLVASESVWSLFNEPAEQERPDESSSGERLLHGQHGRTVFAKQTAQRLNGASLIQ